MTWFVGKELFCSYPKRKFQTSRCVVGSNTSIRADEASWPPLGWLVTTAHWGQGSFSPKPRLSHTHSPWMLFSPRWQHSSDKLLNWDPYLRSCPPQTCFLCCHESYLQKNGLGYTDPLLSQNSSVPPDLPTEEHPGFLAKLTWSHQTWNLSIPPRQSPAFLCLCVLAVNILSPALRFSLDLWNDLLQLCGRLVVRQALSYTGYCHNRGLYSICLSLLRIVPCAFPIAIQAPWGQRLGLVPNGISATEDRSIMATSINSCWMIIVVVGASFLWPSVQRSLAKTSWEPSSVDIFLLQLPLCIPSLTSR